MEESNATCPACGEENGPMGVLGRLLHYCCRACGMWYNRSKEQCEA